MASIDKTYITKEQYIQIREWWCKTYKKQIRELGSYIWLYPFQVYESFQSEKELIITPEFLQNNTKDIDEFIDDSAVWCTSTNTDLWLAQNCKIDFIQERLKVQYQEDWIGFLDIKFNFKHKPFIMEFTDLNKNTVYFYKNIEDGYVEALDEVLVYGTTLFFKKLQYAIDIVCENPYLSENIVTSVMIDFYGVPLKFTQNNVFFEDKEVYVGCLNENIIKYPKIKYSFNKKDALLKKYSIDSIILSGETDVFCATDYKNADIKYLSRYLYFLPDYIKNRIK